MIRGLDLLGGAKFKKEFVQSSEFALGIFAETFGDAYPVVEAAIKAGCKLIRVQLLWSDSHSFGDKDIPKIKKLAAKYNQLANKYPATDIRLSPFCEYGPLQRGIDYYCDIAQLAAPSCSIVATPWTGKPSSKYINEIHGDHAKPAGRYQYSFDGTECTNADVEAYKKKYADAEVFFMWSARFNLKWSMKDTTPRPQRKAFPTGEYIQSIAYLFTDKGETQLPKNWLVKSHAEKHDAQDKKGDKLLIISPIKVNEIILKTKSGKILDKLPYYGSFDGGGYRYYSAQMGFKIALQAHKLGNPNQVGVWIKNNCVAVVNPGFRDGNYR